MQALRYLFSPAGRLEPRPFIAGALAVYVAGMASHFLTTPEAMLRAGLWPFVAAQVLLLWIWFALHAKRLHDAGHSAGLALGASLLYALALALLLLVADSFFNTSDGMMGNANASGALGLILLIYVVTTLLGSTQYDLAWLTVAILTVLTLLPIALMLAVTTWAATRPSRETPAAEQA